METETQVHMRICIKTVRAESFAHVERDCELTVVDMQPKPHYITLQLRPSNSRSTQEFSPDQSDKILTSDLFQGLI